MWCFDHQRALIWIYNGIAITFCLLLFIYFLHKAKCISDAEKKYDRLLKALDPNLSSNYQKRCEEATKEGYS